MDAGGNIIFAVMFFFGIGIMASAAKWIGEAETMSSLIIDIGFLFLGGVVVIATGAYLECEIERWWRARQYRSQ